jgi:cysteine desulfurase
MGMAAALDVAVAELETQSWARVEKLRKILEKALADAAPELMFFGQEMPRLPNTSCFACPGWLGETQVMQMDLAGFAVSAGSACSSGKVSSSAVLRAMGVEDEVARCALRVSLGPTTSEEEVMGFVEAWTKHYQRRRARAA